jgi:anti-sigma factor RsiW
VIAHLTDRQLAAFLDGGLTADEIVALDEHLSACAECRERAAAFGNDRLTDLAAALSRDETGLHPDEARLADYVDGRSASTDDVEAHLAACAECAATVEDLRILQRALVATRWKRAVPLALAAAAVLVVGVGLWRLERAAALPPAPAAPLASAGKRIQDGGAAVVVSGNEISSGLAGLSDAERAKIAAALSSGELPNARNLDRVRGEAGRLMGQTEAGGAFGPRSPVATAVESTEPELRWAGLDGARGYVVTIVDDALRPVAESPHVTGTEWRPAAPLARGRVYTWQVRAVTGGTPRMAPVPPQPEARFFVLGEKDAADVASLRARAGDSRLAGILLAQYGLMEDAEAALSAAGADNPSVTALPRLAAAAKDARKPSSTDRQ